MIVLDHRPVVRAIAIAMIAALAPSMARASAAADSARALLLAGHFAAAERVARANLSRPGPVAPEDSAQAIDVVLDAMFHTYRSSQTDALELARRGVVLRTRAASRVGGDLAGSVATLAGVLAARGRVAEADSMIRIARLELERARTADGLEGARVYRMAGLVHFNARRYSEATAEFRRALQIRQRVLAAGDPRIAEAWINIANVAQTVDDRPAADQALHQVIQMSERVHGLAPDHPFVARAWMGLARERHLNQDYLGALALSERALAMLDRSPDAEPNLVAYTCMQVGWDANETGDDWRAIESCERAWRLFRAADGAQAPPTLSALSALAEYSVSAGDCVRANALAESSLAAVQRARGTAPEESWDEWETLSLARACVGDLKGALLASTATLEGLRRAGLGDRSTALIALRRRGMIFESLGQLDSAGATYRLALLRGLADSGPQSRDVFMAKDHMVSWYMRAGFPDSARTLTEWIVPQYDSLCGPRSRYAGRARAALAAAIAACGDSVGALPPALEAETIGREAFRATVRGFGERQALAEGAARARGLDIALAVGTSRGVPDSTRREIWDALVRSRSLVFDEMASRRHQRGGIADSSEIELGAAREEVARLLARGPAGETRARFDARVAEASDRCDRAERRAAASSTPVRLDRARAAIGLREVESGLRPGDALLAFAKYGVERRTKKDWEYAAFIRSPSGRIALLPLGRAGPIEATLTAWRDELSRAVPADRAVRAAATRRCDAAGDRVRRAIWDPARAELAGARRVVVVPDGSLSLVPFEALPVGRGHYLVESAPLLVRVAAERDLVPSSDSPGGRGLLAMGGMSYDARPKETGLIAAIASSDRGLPPCREFGEIRFAPLAGTEEEASEVRTIFSQSSFAAEPATRVEAGEATEAACRAQAPGRRVIHLATHGFFVDPACAAPGSDSDRGTSGLAAALDLPSSAPIDPLRLSGLAFAGANQRATATDGANDGVLTAGEVASLDLEGVQIVTLSACESGLGMPVTGEGVLGLERAFHVAGAPVVVMSLWAVDDRATRAWMSDFYRSLLLGHHDAAEAARTASLAALERLRKAKAPTHPGAWAMFVPSGLSRP